MVVLRRLSRIYRFYIIGLIFCCILPTLVPYLEDLYKIFFTIPTFTIIFYPLYASIIVYSDILFLGDYLYYYINPSSEVLLRVKDFNRYILKKFLNCFLLFFIKYIIICYYIFNKLLLSAILICIIEVFIIFFLSVRLLPNITFDKTIIFILLILLIIRQCINPLLI